MIATIGALPVECMVIVVCLAVGMVLGSWLDDRFGKK